MKIYNSFSKETGLERTPASLKTFSPRNTAVGGNGDMEVPILALAILRPSTLRSKLPNEPRCSAEQRRPASSSPRHWGCGSHSKLTTDHLQADKSRQTVIFYNLSAFVGFCRLLYACCMGFVGFFRLFEPQNLHHHCRMSGFVARQKLPSRVKAL